MNKAVEELERDLLKLDHRLRARLAQALLASLDALSDDENEKLWAEESERRAGEMRADPTLGTPIEEVLEEIRAKLR